MLQWVQLAAMTVTFPATLHYPARMIPIFANPIPIRWATSSTMQKQHFRPRCGTGGVESTQEGAMITLWYAVEIDTTSLLSEHQIREVQQNRNIKIIPFQQSD